jgi:hypothetical protein
MITYRGEHGTPLPEGVHRVFPPEDLDPKKMAAKLDKRLDAYMRRKRKEWSGNSDKKQRTATAKGLDRLFQEMGKENL